MKTIKLLITTLLIVIVTGASAQSASRSYVDLTSAAEQSVHAVVHIKTTFLYRTSGWDDFFSGSFWEDFFNFSSPFGTHEQQVMGAGSGVIISADGYIVTNNHVVENAQDITVPAIAYNNASTVSLVLKLMKKQSLDGQVPQVQEQIIKVSILQLQNSTKNTTRMLRLLGIISVTLVKMILKDGVNYPV